MDLDLSYYGSLSICSTSDDSVEVRGNDKYNLIIHYLFETFFVFLGLVKYAWTHFSRFPIFSDHITPK